MLATFSWSRCQPPNKQMQRARIGDKCVLGYAHRRVADLPRYAARLGAARQLRSVVFVLA
jgi:hypothetical protein